MSSASVGISGACACQIFLWDRCFPNALRCFRSLLAPIARFSLAVRFVPPANATEFSTASCHPSQTCSTCQYHARRKQCLRAGRQLYRPTPPEYCFRQFAQRLFARVSATVPLVACGHTKCPRSSRLATNMTRKGTFSSLACTSAPSRVKACRR